MQQLYQPNLHPTAVKRTITPEMFAQIPKGLQGFKAEHYRELEDTFGIYFPDQVLSRAVQETNLLSKGKGSRSAMDAALQPLVTTPSIITPLQFLQNFLPGNVHVTTAARKIDEIVGMMVSGSWEDEQVVQGILELTGDPVPYGDYTNTPFASWNLNWNAYSVVRFEEGLQVLNLEQARASRINVDSAAAKRDSCALQLEIQRNAIGFFGYNNGVNNTYGLLNAPGLPAYVPFPNGASGFPQWSKKTTLEIIADIQSMIVTIREGSQDVIDPERVPMTLVVATNVIEYMKKPNDFDLSAEKWLKENYPLIKTVSCPEFVNAVSGTNACYLFADEVNDFSTDDRRTFAQVVPAKYMMQGVQQVIKGYLEGSLMATAGVFCKRPFAVARGSGN